MQKNSSPVTWQVRAIVSDHTPLAGTFAQVLSRAPEHLIQLNENPLSIYLHHGGDDAVYFDFVADDSGRLKHIEVEVDTSSPGKALLLARKAVNQLLDALSRPNRLPITIQRLEVLSPRDGQPLAYQLLLPHYGAVRMGPLGGIWQYPVFAPYDAIFREAITSSSPFYRLLCACRIYEGTNSIRKWTKAQCDRLGIKERLPRDPRIEPADLERKGFTPEFASEIRTAHDLFDKLRAHRDAIAHFLYEGRDEEEEKQHVYVAEGEALFIYSAGSSVLLEYASLAINDLRLFYSRYLDNHLHRGSILPMVEIRERFRVRDPQTQ